MRNAIAIAILLCSCDSSDDATSPAAYCRSFVDLICTRAVACGETDDEHRTCVATATAQLTGGRSCSVTTTIRNTREMDSCLAQLEAASCDELADTLPPECREQLIIPE